MSTTTFNALCQYPRPPKYSTPAPKLARYKPSLVVVCICLHVGLVIIHAIPAVLAAVSIEDSGVSINSWDHGADLYGLSGIRRFLVTPGINIAIQLAGICYSAVLVWLTQRLALRRSLHLPETFTALHDKTNAWMGVGSSAVALIQQHRLRTAFGGVSAIAIYLLAIFGIHITAANLILIMITSTYSVAPDAPDGLVCEPYLIITNDGFTVTLNTAPLIIGLVLSIVLLITSCVLIRQPKVSHLDDRNLWKIDPALVTRLDSAGLLQFAWLIANTPHNAILEPMTKVQVPSTEKLREAGMFQSTGSDTFVMEDINRGLRAATRVGRNKGDVETEDSDFLLK